MAEKHIVVQGAVCKCQFGQLVDKIKVLSHKKHYANDKDASKKLIVTTNEIGGATLEKNTFGNCPKMGTNPPPPCKPVITEWKNFYEKVTLSNGGNVILEDSKAVCAIAGTSCIEIIDHGQRTQASKQNFKNANAAVHKQINPLVSPKEMYEPQPQHEDIANGVNGEEKEVAKCTIYFDKPNNYQNDFGFDSYELSKKGCKNKEKLKNEYTKYTIRDKEYLTPWVSIREGQTIKLAAKVKGKLNGEKISIQSPYFSFSPEEITEKTREIKITCNETFTSDHIVEAKVREEVVGAIHFMENEVKKISVQPIYVIDDTTDWGKIEKYTKNELLQQYFLRAFSSPLIEVSIKEPFKLSMLESNYSKSLHLGRIKKTLKKIKEDYLKKTNKITIINENSDTRPALIKSLNDLYVISNQDRELLDIPLFFTPFECIIPNGEIDNFNNGFASGNSAILMFLGNDNKQPKVEIPHEVMHILELPHTFSETFEKDKNKKHIFRKGATQNYMDYDNNKKYTQKWQWELMRKSNRWLLVLLIFLSLISCSTQKYATYTEDCSIFLKKNAPDTVYFGDVVCSNNYSITESEKTYPFPKNKYKKIKEIKKKNGETIRVGKFILRDKIKYSYDTIKDTLGLKKNKYRTYYSDGKIESIHYSLGSLSIGKWYFFNEKGDVIKSINEEKGWNLCWEQIYFIATQFIGENMLNNIRALNMNRYNPYDAIEKETRNIPYEKKIWFFSYYYKNCRFVVDIEDETGVVINHRQIPLNTSDQLYSEDYFEGKILKQ